MKIGNVRIDTGIRKDADYSENEKRIDEIAVAYSLETAFDVVQTLKGFPWNRHEILNEHCSCLACKLQTRCFELMSLKPLKMIEVKA